MQNRLFSLTAALLLTAGVAAAQTATPAIRGREQNQRARIRQGVATGALTPREAARMRGREAGLTAQRQAARADGVVTPAERQDLRRTENKDSRAIYRQKHDGQVR